MLARNSKSSFIESRRISPFLTSFIGFTSHLIDHILSKCLVRTDEVFSIGTNFPLKNWIFSRLVYKTNPDVIHLHWGGYSFITPVLLAKLSKFKASRLIVTTHDYYYFTGGCHIPMDCPEHSNNCQSCPMAKNLIVRMKYEYLQTHTARRSFCSNEYLKGTDPIIIMAMSGHKSHKSFMRYIKVSNEQFADKMAKIWQERELAGV